MRDPENLIFPTIDEEKTSYLRFNNVPEFDIPDYNLSDPKEFKKYIANVKKTLRGSFEYQELVQFLRNNMNMNVCAVYENVTNANTSNIKIHVHHDPFTIEDIILIVVRKRQSTYESLDVEMVVEEVLKLHYQLKVGLIPVAETVHDLIHNGFYFIPVQNVLGRYREFVNEYKQYNAIEQEQLNTLEKIEEHSKDEEFIRNMNSLLERHYIYIDMGVEPELSYEEMISKLKDVVRNKVNQNSIKTSTPDSL